MVPVHAGRDLSPSNGLREAVIQMSWDGFTGSVIETAQPEAFPGRATVRFSLRVFDGAFPAVRGILRQAFL